MAGGACVAGGVCVAGGHAWQGSMRGWGAGGQAYPVGGTCVARMPPLYDTTRYGRSMSGWYASYWNAFLFCELRTVKCLYPKIYKKNRYIFRHANTCLNKAFVISKKTLIFEYNLPILPNSEFIRQIDSEAEWDILGYLNVLFI